jgi:topoisomerase-4 subunit A
MATSIPPHNAAELCDAALHLIENRKATTAELLTYVKGPDFPTGGVVVESNEAIHQAYDTGRGSFRVRARWQKEEGGRGTWVAVVTEIPYGVAKGRLIERIAELLENKKLPLVADLRDESAEDVRIVIEPRNRSVDPAVMMESLFRVSDLESRIPLNMNVLMSGQIPRVVSLGEALLAWLDHRREVLIRRSRHRLAEIERRLEILNGLLIVFLNLDEVIRIIRQEDEPKTELMRVFTLTELQANAILDTRLRALRKLEEMEIKREFEALTEEKGQTERIINSPARQWKLLAADIREVRKAYGPQTPLGKRRTTFAEAAPLADVELAEAIMEREPLTFVLSEKGWVRALKGHVQDLAGLQFKGDDGFKLSFFTESTAKVLVLASNGKLYTLDAGKLPGGRGFGDPVKLMVDFDEGADVVTAVPYRPGTKLLIAGTDARGFIAPADEVVSSTRKGKQVLNVRPPARAALIVPADGDHVAVIGQNRKLIVFPLRQVAEMSRGSGVRLQRYRDGGLSDARVFSLADGLTWTDTSARNWTVAKADLADWIGNRSDAGRLPPKGFPKSNRFS